MRSQTLPVFYSKFNPNKIKSNTILEFKILKNRIAFQIQYDSPRITRFKSNTILKTP